MGLHGCCASRLGGKILGLYVDLRVHNVVCVSLGLNPAMAVQRGWVCCWECAACKDVLLAVQWCWKRSALPRVVAPCRRGVWAVEHVRVQLCAHALLCMHVRVIRG